MPASFAKLSFSMFCTSASHTDRFGRPSNCSSARASLSVVGTGPSGRKASSGGTLDATSFDDAAGAVLEFSQMRHPQSYGHAKCPLLPTSEAFLRPLEPWLLLSAREFLQMTLQQEEDCKGARVLARPCVPSSSSSSWPMVRRKAVLERYAAL
eukprot:1828172-Prymnesium_polylepis.4